MLWSVQSAVPLLQRGLFLSAIVLQDKTAAAWAPQETQFLQEISICSNRVPSHGQQGNLCFGAWSTSSPSFMFVLLFLTSFPAYAVFCLFLSTFFQRYHHLVWGAQLCPAVSPSELAEGSCIWDEAIPASSHNLHAPLPTPFHLHPVHPSTSFSPRALRNVRRDNEHEGELLLKSTLMLVNWVLA